MGAWRSRDNLVCGLAVNREHPCPIIRASTNWANDICCGASTGGEPPAADAAATRFQAAAGFVAGPDKNRLPGTFLPAAECDFPRPRSRLKRRFVDRNAEFARHALHQRLEPVHLFRQFLLLGFERLEFGGRDAVVGAAALGDIVHADFAA